MWGFILLGITLVVALPQNSILYGSNAFLLSERGPTPRRCVYSKIYNMLQARCADLNLREFPPNLQKDIQVYIHKYKFVLLLIIIVNTILIIVIFLVISIDFRHFH